MSAFLFSINSVFPIFLLIGVGWLLKRQGVLPQSVVGAISTIAFNVAFPALLFREMAQATIAQVFHPLFVIYGVGGTALTFALTWAGAELFIKDKAAIGAFVQGAFRGNYAIMGLMLITNILGHTGKGILLTAFAIPAYNILSVALLTFRSRHPQSGSVRKAATSIARNPLIIGILLGLPFSLFRIPLFTSPDAKLVATTVRYLAELANPLAMLAIGASISSRTMLKGLPKILAATAIKLAASPLILVGTAYLLRNALGFSGEDLLVLFVLFGMPTAVASYIMASKMDADADLAAGILLLTSLLSVFTITLGIYLFKASGLI
ncbi:MAG: AEC family transporter [Prevotellaceae bacterium]|jgi:predicted permease|nr:AEC family transporter [Prevotellaceae bacterium]